MMPLINTRQVQRPGAPNISNLQVWTENVGIVPTMASSAWQAANLIVYTPVILPAPASTPLHVFIGAALAGFCAAGVYLPDSDGRPGEALWVSGAVVPLTASSWLTINPPVGNAPIAGPGLLYLAFQADNTTLQMVTFVTLTTDGQNMNGQIFTEQGAILGLPAIATPTQIPAAAKVPVMSIG